MAPNSSKLALLPKVVAKNGNKLVNEKIDERILRLLGLEDVFDIDYDTYASLLRERMGAARMKKQTLPTEEVEMITNEWKRVKGKKGRFKVKKITAASFKKGTAVGMNFGKQKLLMGVKPLAPPPAISKVSPLEDIKGLLNEIIGYLIKQNKTQKDSLERSRKEKETSKRTETENKLEKGFSAAIKVAERVLAPVKSFLSRIIDFFMSIFWGKVFLKLLDWFSNPANKKKIDSLFRFFGDHWPKLLALYLRFGTGLGKFVGGLTKLVFLGTRKLLQVVASLVGAKGAAKFLGGRGGKLVSAGLQVATTVGTTMALSSGIEQFSGLENLGQSETKTPTFFGGGLANFKNLFGFLGGGPGYVSGKKGIDKIPAMLSDGEFVMSRGAVQKYGVDTLSTMNAAGGGTNRPKMIRGTAYASGGGLVSNQQSSPTGGGFLGALGRFLPGTGTAMAPKSGGQRDVQGIQQTMAGYQNKLLGINLGGVNFPRGNMGQYSQQENRRYYERTGKYFVPTRYPGGAGIHGLYTPPKQQKTPVMSQTNQRLNVAIQNARDVVNIPGGAAYKPLIDSTASTALKMQQRSDVLRDAMRKAGMRGAEESMNIYGKPIVEKYAEGGFAPKINSSFLINNNNMNFDGNNYQQISSDRINPASISKSPKRVKDISPPVKAPVIVRSDTSQNSGRMSVPPTPGTPQVPAFSSFRLDDSRRRILAIHGIG